MSDDMTATWIDLGPADAVPDGQSRAFTAAGRKLCVIADRGCFYAVADLCTHGHAFLSEGYCDVADGVVECPLHGGLFDFRTGAAVGAPAEKAVASYPVKVEDGRLLIELGEA